MPTFNRSSRISLPNISTLLISPHKFQVNSFYSYYYIGLLRLIFIFEGVKAILTNFGTTNKGVFPVIRASIPFQTKVSKYLSFGHQETDVNDTHGILDKVTGLFRIGTSGLYLFLFNGLAARVGLKVNGIEISGAKVVHFEIPTGSSGSADAFWALLELTKGDRVGIFCTNQSVVYTTNSAKNCKFSGILLAYDFHPDV